ncbi:MAG TPA: glycosyltransferase family 4 protein [Vicinamibacterales bacterium]|jgi:glycosyltransferase involved in cell wall biosynthesis
MRILLANDGFGDAGGVQNYLDAVAAGLASRGHTLAILHRDATPAPIGDPSAAAAPGPPFAAAATRSLPQFSTAGDGVGPALDRVARWAPDLCFSHNMNVLEIDRALIARWPVVKFMHGYFGTCIGGQKRHGFPTPQPCDRRFGVACLALYGPRHCGELKPGPFLRHYRWAREQHGLLPRYRTIVVASQHMKREFIRNGVEPSRIQVNPLFPTHNEQPFVGSGLSRINVQVRLKVDPTNVGDWTVAFVGRMTVLKGGDLLVDAIAQASKRLGRPIRLLLIGDGPQRAAWEQRASERRVPCTAVGWLNGEARWTALRQATLLALPSSWPEPFGLVGLEAAALGIPAVAFDVGGVREWLRPGINGYLAPGDPPRASGLADAIVTALSDDDEVKAMGLRAIGVARQMSLDRHLDRLDAIFVADFATHAHSAGR